MEHIAIVTGGFSNEKDISLESAQTIYHNINKEKYKAYIVNCLNINNFQVIINTKKIEIEIEDFTFQLNGKKIVFDKIFLMIHGSPGEDGKLCDYFDSKNIPYTSANKKKLELTFNKYKCNKYLNLKGFNVPQSVLFYKNFTPTFPCIVKPASSGSSFGISLVKNIKELNNAIKHAKKHDKEVMIEDYIEGREFTCGIYNSKNKIITLPITEIISENELFDYDAKYSGKSKEITPAKINKIVEKQIKEISKNVYHKINLSGFVRIDFIVSKEQVFLIEINTIPGFSEKSIFPQMLKQKQITISDFITDQLNNLNN
tara:strand:+ start:39654 stop:40598 length:945 start_codon:yes stop_codon:yes gene_type:complete